MKPLVRMVVCLGIVATLACGLSGCRRGQQPASPQLRIGMVPLGTTHRYWLAVHAGALVAANELGVDLLWPPAFRDGDVDGQIKALQRMQELGAKAIGVAPINDPSLHQAVGAVARTGIPMLSFDTSLFDVNLPYVGSDNVLGGRLAGEYLVKSLPPNGTVLALRTSKDAESVEQRVGGFLAAIAARPDITALSDIYAGTVIEDAFVASHDVLDALRARDGGLSAIFCPNEITVVAMMRALENLHLDGKITVVGFDRSPWITNLFVGKGKISALVVQDPNTMGYLAVKELVAALRGTPMPREALTDVRLVTRDLAFEPRLSQLLHPIETLER
jgi:ABC-type sugar transport system substrate-binding protein